MTSIERELAALHEDKQYNWRELAELYKVKKPDLWKKCCPRVYQGAGGYESAPYVALTPASSITWMDARLPSRPVAAESLAIIASRAFNDGLPTFFVSKDLLSEVSNDLPPNARWTDAKLPFEAGLLYLPVRALTDPEGKPVNVLAWARQRKGEQIMVGSRTRVICAEDAFIVCGICDSWTERLYSRTIKASQTPYIVGPTVGEVRGVFDVPITSDDATFLSQITSLCFALLLIQRARPDFVTEGHRKTGARTEKVNGDVWTPNFIGRTNRIRREPQGGTHASPRSKRRRGHWTHQPIGPFQKNPDFVPISTLPYLEDGRIDWEKVPNDTQRAFWDNHELMWIDSISDESNPSGEKHG